jgi:hypothetical protein
VIALVSQFMIQFPLACAVEAHRLECARPEVVLPRHQNSDRLGVAQLVRPRQLEAEEDKETALLIEEAIIEEACADAHELGGPTMQFRTTVSNFAQSECDESETNLAVRAG